MIPYLEIANFFGSYLLSAHTTAKAEERKDSAIKDKMILKMAGFKEESTDKARSVSDPHTKLTRRTIALFSVFMLIGVIIYYGAGDSTIFIETKVATGGWFLFPERIVSKFHEIKGIPFLDIYDQVLISIFGLYFGNNHSR